MNLLRLVTLSCLIGALTACGVSQPDNKDKQTAEELAQEVADAAAKAVSDDESVEDKASQRTAAAEDTKKLLCDKFLASNAAQKVKDIIGATVFDKVDTRVVIVADAGAYILMVYPVAGGKELGQSFNYTSDVNMSDIESLVGIASVNADSSPSCMLPLK